MDDVRKEIESGRLEIVGGDGNVVIFKMSPELKKSMKNKLDEYDRFLEAKFKRVFGKENHEK